MATEVWASNRNYPAGTYTIPAKSIAQGVESMSVSFSRQNWTNPAITIKVTLRRLITTSLRRKRSQQQSPRAGDMSRHWSAVAVLDGLK